MLSHRAIEEFRWKHPFLCAKMSDWEVRQMFDEVESEMLEKFGVVVFDDYNLTKKW